MAVFPISEEFSKIDFIENENKNHIISSFGGFFDDCIDLSSSHAKTQISEKERESV